MPGVKLEDHGNPFQLDVRVALLLTFGFWTIIAFVTAARCILIDGSRSIPEAVTVSSLFCYIWASLTLPVMSFAARWPLNSKVERLPHAARHLCLAVLLAALAVVPEVMTLPFLPTAHGELTFFQRYFMVASGFFDFGFFSYWAIVAFQHGSDYYRRLQASQLLAAQLETSLKQAEMDYLRMQLNPHFLFNTLNSIDVLMREDVEIAHRMLVNLSELLRLAMRPQSSQLTQLRAELRFLEHYISIERTRFHDRLAVNLQCDPDALDALVPSLILQPLVENAIRHGAAKRTSNREVSIRVCVQGSFLEIEVADNGPGVMRAQPGSQSDGVGLTNTRARLKHLFGDGHVFTIKNALKGGAVVTLSFPLAFCESERALI